MRRTLEADCQASRSLRPSGPVAPRHVHSNEDEVFQVLEGEFEFLLGDDVVRATPGAFIYSPKGQLHSFTNVGDGPGRVMILFSPAGIEGFFEESGEPAESLTLPPSEDRPFDKERFMAIARR